jgi:hypothetical protein
VSFKRRPPRRWSRVELEEWKADTGLGLDLARRAVASAFRTLAAVDPVELLGVFEVHADRQPGGWLLYWADLAGWGVAAWEVEPAEQVVVLHSLKWS